MAFASFGGFLNPVLLAGALLILPLLLLYLLKPKPKLIFFPTIMFIKRIEETRRFRSVLNKFIRDPLLLLQILLISLLALSLANPFLLVERATAEDQAIAIVIDGSASMLAKDVNPNRFEAAISKAIEVVSNIGGESKVSLVMAENIPITLLDNGQVGEALSILDRVRCGETGSNTGDAMILAKDLLAKNDMKKTVYVLSDFSKTQGDVLAGRRILTLNGITVEFIKFNNDEGNAGLISIDARRASMNKNLLYLTYTIKNFDDTEREVTHKVYIDNTLKTISTHTLGPGVDELFYVNDTLNNERHFITIEVSNGAELEVDDFGYAVIEELDSYRSMLLTTESEDMFLAYAIEAQSNNVMRTVEPPIIPTIRDFDLIIVGTIKEDAILPGTFRDIKNYVSEGNSLIVVATDDLGNIEDQNFYELMPVILKNKVNLNKNINVEENDIVNDVSLENIVIKRYYTAETKVGATVLADIEGNPVLAYWDYGKGRVIYVGVNPTEEWSNMHYSSTLPIFWSQLVAFVNQRDDLVNKLDYRTGEYVLLGDELQVTNPLGDSVVTKSIFLDKQGYYRINGDNVEKHIAANLMDEEESNIKTDLYYDESASGGIYFEKTSREDLFKYILFLGLIALVIEMWIYRRRGKL